MTAIVKKTAAQYQLSARPSRWSDCEITFASIGSRKEKTIKSVKLGCGRRFLIATAPAAKRRVTPNRMGSRVEATRAAKIAAAPITRKAPRYKKILMLV